MAQGLVACNKDYLQVEANTVFVVEGHSILKSKVDFVLVEVTSVVCGLSQQLLKPVGGGIENFDHFDQLYRFGELLTN